MALIKCYECNKEISDSAASCPHCGAPVKSNNAKTEIDPALTNNDSENGTRKISFPLFIGIIVLPIVFIWFLFRKGYSKKARIFSIVYLIVSILIFRNDYNDDSTDQVSEPASQETRSEPASNGRPNPSDLASFSAQSLADAYEQNTVAADRQFKNKWFLINGVVKSINTDFSDSAYITLSVDNMFNSPQAKFIKSEEDLLADLRQGQKITAMCIGNGDIAKTPMLKNCSMVK